MQVSVENKSFSAVMTSIDLYVYTPNNLKTPASKYGKTGVNQIVGPLSILNGELNPWPSAISLAIFPVSYPKGAFSTTGSFPWCCTVQKRNMRMANATITIREIDVAARFNGFSLPFYVGFDWPA